MARKNEVQATSGQQAAVRWTVEGILRDVYPVQLAYTKPTKDEVQFCGRSRGA